MDNSPGPAWTKTEDCKNSSTILDEALHEDLDEYWGNNQDITLLQYVDDLLIVVESKKSC